MDYLSVLGSINIIAALCFLVALGFIGYETFMYFKERGQAGKVNVPKFDPNAQTKIIVPNLQQSKPQKPLVFNAKNRLLPIAVAFSFLIATGLIAWKFNTEDPLDTTIVSRSSNAAPQRQSTIPTSLPTQAPTVEPTQTLLAAAQPTQTPTPTVLLTPTPFPLPMSSSQGSSQAGQASTSVVVVASSAAQITTTTVPTQTQTLPEAGTSYHYIFILALAGASVVIMSLLF